MRMLASDRFGRWTRRAGLVALGVLTWTVFPPGGFFWSAVLVAGLVGSALATVFLVRSRSSNPPLAQVITSAEAEPVLVPAGRFTGGALRPRGEGRP